MKIFLLTVAVALVASVSGFAKFNKFKRNILPGDPRYGHTSHHQPVPHRVYGPPSFQPIDATHNFDVAEIVDAKQSVPVPHAVYGIPNYVDQTKLVQTVVQKQPNDFPVFDHPQNDFSLQNYLPPNNNFVAETIGRPVVRPHKIYGVPEFIRPQAPINIAGASNVQITRGHQHQPVVRPHPTYGVPDFKNTQQIPVGRPVGPVQSFIPVISVVPAVPVNHHQPPVHIQQPVAPIAPVHLHQPQVNQVSNADIPIDIPKPAVPFTGHPDPTGYPARTNYPAPGSYPQPPDYERQATFNVPHTSYGVPITSDFVPSQQIQVTPTIIENQFQQSAPVETVQHQEYGTPAVVENHFQPSAPVGQFHQAPEQPEQLVFEKPIQSVELSSSHLTENVSAPVAIASQSQNTQQYAENGGYSY